MARLVDRWCVEAGIAPDLWPDPSRLESGPLALPRAVRAGADPDRIGDWQERFGFELPPALRVWLGLSDGLFLDGGPLIHPLSGIGPMVPFVPIPGMVIQPESWFELGNPGRETVCVDLGYRWPGPGGDCPLFTSGDDDRGLPPRLIAPGFAAWMLALIRDGGLETWTEPGFVPLGDPWLEHRRRVPRPPLPSRLGPLLPLARELIARGLDDRAVGAELDLSRADVEAIVRYLQHATADMAAVEAS